MTTARETLQAAIDSLGLTVRARVRAVVEVSQRRRERALAQLAYHAQAR